MNTTFKELKELIRNLYPNEETIPLHRPIINNSYTYLKECIDTGFVSSVGKAIVDFEQKVAAYTGATFAIATMNGTSAIHASLYCIGVTSDHMVLAPNLTFVATLNAISFTGAEPILVDCDVDDFGLSPNILHDFLSIHTHLDDKGNCIFSKTGKTIKACMATHIFGNSNKIEEIKNVCDAFNITLIEDAAESLGTFSKSGKHTGTTGKLGTFSFNGNKIITTGGGGMIVTDDPALAKRLKNITTTAKTPHEYEFYHTELAFNYRMPNLNAALGLSQMELFPKFLEDKREIYETYRSFFQPIGEFKYTQPSEGTKSNHWLNSILTDSPDTTQSILEWMIREKIYCRPIWELMSNLPMYNHCYKTDISNSQRIRQLCVSLPSSAREEKIF
ncbi:MAG: LegC family aminotransferase [Bdellovibrionota bacterium]